VTGELLDPLLPLLVRALRSRHAPTVTSALQALSLLMQSQLAGLQKTAGGEWRAALLQTAGCWLPQPAWCLSLHAVGLFPQPMLPARLVTPLPRAPRPSPPPRPPHTQMLARL
jgi:TM2 domain-containing membrane protein YozV